MQICLICTKTIGGEKNNQEEIIMDYAKESLRLHEEWKGKIEVIATVPVASLVRLLPCSDPAHGLPYALLVAYGIHA